MNGCPEQITTRIKGSIRFEGCGDHRRLCFDIIDAGFPIPYLNLYHSSRSFKFYEWHWFLLNGYELWDDTLRVKAVTYGSWNWLDFDALWETDGRLRAA